jgi:AcrR family transcriptional regulator
MLDGDWSSDVCSSDLKGTLYIYFNSKEDLYVSALYNGYSRIVDTLKDQMNLGTSGPEENLGMAVREIVSFAYSNPNLFKMMRTLPAFAAFDHEKWAAKRRELSGIIESMIRQGVELGVFKDSRPDLTARYLPGFVRSVLIDDIEAVDRDVLTDHILGFVTSAIGVRAHR